MATKEQETNEAAEATKYPVGELVAAAASVFNTQPELMAGALYGKTEATKEEAEKLLQTFLKKPVKQATN